MLCGWNHAPRARACVTERTQPLSAAARGVRGREAERLPRGGASRKGPGACGSGTAGGRRGGGGAQRGDGRQRKGSCDLPGARLQVLSLGTVLAVPGADELRPQKLVGRQRSPLPRPGSLETKSHLHGVPGALFPSCIHWGPKGSSGAGSCRAALTVLCAFSQDEILVQEILEPNKSTSKMPTAGTTLSTRIFKEKSKYTFFCLVRVRV